MNNDVIQAALDFHRPVHVAEETKPCSKCGFEKPRSAFHRDKKQPDGLRTVCKDCTLAYGAKYRARKKEREREAVAYLADQWQGSQAKVDQLLSWKTSLWVAFFVLVALVTFYGAGYSMGFTAATAKCIGR